MLVPVRLCGVTCNVVRDIHRLSVAVVVPCWPNHMSFRVGTTKAVTSVAGHERYRVVITLQLADLDAVYCMAEATH
jgi:hypothetical protein